MKRFFILMLMIFAMFSCTEVSEDTGNNDNYNDNYSDNTTNDNTNTDNNTNNDNYNDNYNDNNTNTSYTVYFYAGEVNWDEVYVYSWDDYNKNEAWPGERMSSDGNGWYSATVNYPKIIFNGGNGGPQTGDLKSQDGYFVPENSGSSISGTWYTSKPNVGNNPEPDYPDYPDDPEPDYPDDPYYPDEPEEISAPATLSAYATSESSISLSWSSVSGATSYYVYYGTSSNNYYAQSYGGYYGTSAEITKLSAETTYYFWVKASDGSQTSDFSSIAYATTEKSTKAIIYFVGANSSVEDGSTNKAYNHISIGNIKQTLWNDILNSKNALDSGVSEGPYTIEAGTYLLKFTTAELKNAIDGYTAVYGYRTKRNDKYYYYWKVSSSSSEKEFEFEAGKTYTVYKKSYDSGLSGRGETLKRTVRQYIDVQEGTD